MPWIQPTTSRKCGDTKRPHTMAASPVLVDSSYYVGMLRARQDPFHSLAIAAAERDLAICGVIRCEVGRGLREPATLKRLPGILERDGERSNRQRALTRGRAHGLDPGSASPHFGAD